MSAVSQLGKRNCLVSEQSRRPSDLNPHADASNPCFIPTTQTKPSTPSALGGRVIGDGLSPRTWWTMRSEQAYLDSKQIYPARIGARVVERILKKHGREHPFNS